jgi:pimeloyl-ACP methyl ester carboxylesterase
MKPLCHREHVVRNGPVDIYLYEKHPQHCTHQRVIVLAHGSSSAGRESFGLQGPGIEATSLVDVLAQKGFDVFTLDGRGFGRSTHPDEHLSTVEASEDLNAVVDYISKLRGAPKINLLAWSWGTQYAGMFLLAHPDKINRYIACSQMHANSPAWRSAAPESRSSKEAAISPSAKTAGSSVSIQ